MWKWGVGYFPIFLSYSHSPSELGCSPTVWRVAQLMQLQRSWEGLLNAFGNYFGSTHQAMGLPRRFSGKDSACQCRRHGFNPWVRKIPWRRKWQPTPVCLLRKPHEKRSLVGYNPRGCKRVKHHWVSTEHASGDTQMFRLFYPLLWVDSKEDKT